MTSNHKGLTRNFLSLLTLQGANYLLPLLTLPYLARVLGSDRFGALAFGNSALQILQVLVDFGFTLSATRAVAIHRNDPDHVQKMFSAITWCNILLALAGFGILLVLCATVPSIRREWALFVIGYGMVVGTAMFPVWLFQGMERMGYITALNIAAKVLFTLLIFLMVHHPADYLFAPAANSLGFLLAGGLSLWFARRTFALRIGLPNWPVMWTQMKQSAAFFASRISLSLYTSSSAFCLGLVSGSGVVGLYSAAERLYLAAQNINSPLNIALYPYMSNKKDLRLYKKIFTLAVCLNTVACLIALWLAAPIIQLIFGAAYLPSADYLRIFLVTAILSVPSILLGYPLLGALGQLRYANGSVIVGSLIQILGLALLVLSGHLTPRSAAFMVLLAESSILTMRIHGVVKHRAWHEALT